VILGDVEPFVEQIHAKRDLQFTRDLRRRIWPRRASSAELEASYRRRRAGRHRANLRAIQPACFTGHAEAQGPQIRVAALVILLSSSRMDRSPGGQSSAV